MENILKKIRVEINPNIYLKDPFSSELGKDIILKSVSMMQELGFEQFTFKKLSSKIDCTESAIYRYFENKHTFLLYLNAWYWAWMEHNYVYATANLIDPDERLSLAIRLMVDGPIYRQNDFLDPDLLRYIVVNESLKGYLTKEVDSEHESGIFSQVYRFSDRVTSLIREINPSYLFPKALVSTLMESSLMQSFNSQHLPGMIDSKPESNDRFTFFHQLVKKAIS